MFAAAARPVTLMLPWCNTSARKPGPKVSVGHHRPMTAVMLQTQDRTKSKYQHQCRVVYCKCCPGEKQLECWTEVLWDEVCRGRWSGWFSLQFYFTNKLLHTNKWPGLVSPWTPTSDRDSCLPAPQQVTRTRVSLQIKKACKRAN